MRDKHRATNEDAVDPNDIRKDPRRGIWSSEDRGTNQRRRGEAALAARPRASAGVVGVVVDPPRLRPERARGPRHLALGSFIGVLAFEWSRFWRFNRRWR